MSVCVCRSIHGRMDQMWNPNRAILASLPILPNPPVNGTSTRGGLLLQFASNTVHPGNLARQRTTWSNEHLVSFRTSVTLLRRRHEYLYTLIHLRTYFHFQQYSSPSNYVFSYELNGRSHDTSVISSAPLSFQPEPVVSRGR